MTDFKSNNARINKVVTELFQQNHLNLALRKER